jgi:hypothetical protein
VVTEFGSGWSQPVQRREVDLIAERPTSNDTSLGMSSFRRLSGGLAYGNARPHGGFMASFGPAFFDQR